MRDFRIARNFRAIAIFIGLFLLPIRGQLFPNTVLTEEMQSFLTFLDLTPGACSRICMSLDECLWIEYCRGLNLCNMLKQKQQKDRQFSINTDTDTSGPIKNTIGCFPIMRDSDKVKVSERPSCSVQEGSLSDWSSWSTCSVTCDGGSRARIRFCTSTSCSGESREMEPCNIRPCRKDENSECPTLEPSGSVQIEYEPTGSPRYAGTKAVYSCTGSYAVQGTNSRTCGSTGQWSAPEPICIATCPALEPSGGVQIEYEPTGSPRYAGTKAVYSCTGSYAVQGTNSRTCGSTGQWRDPEPSCVATCPTLEPSGGVQIKYEPTGSHHYAGTKAAYSCTGSYAVQGTNSRTCGSTGQWSDPEPTCVATCQALEPSAGVQIEYEPTDSPRYAGTKAVYSCTGSYAVQGTNSRTCGSTGQWSDTEPTCVPTCPALEPSGGVQIEYEPTGSPRYAGTKAVYSCTGSYAVKGTNSRTCGSTGQWSDPEPDCVATCPALEPSGGVQIEYEPTGSPRYAGTKAVYSCTGSYAVQGTNSRTCGSTGHWSDPVPSCVATCPELKPSIGVQIEYEPTDSPRYAGTKAVYSCTGSYAVQGTNSRTCGSTGQWSDPEPTCVATCPALVPGEHVAITYSSTGGLHYAGTQATYSCTGSHTLRGTSNRICGSTGGWSDPEPACVATCPALVPPDGVSIVYSSESLEPPANNGDQHYLTGTEVKYTCTSNTCVWPEPRKRTCKDTGQWSNADHNCETLCKGTSKIWNNHLYWISHIQLNISTAETKCSTLGGTLAEITTTEENQALEDWVRDSLSEPVWVASLIYNGTYMKCDDILIDKVCAIWKMPTTSVLHFICEMKTTGPS